MIFETPCRIFKETSLQDANVYRTSHTIQKFVWQNFRMKCWTVSLLNEFPYMGWVSMSTSKNDHSSYSFVLLVQQVSCSLLNLPMFVFTRPAGLGPANSSWQAGFNHLDYGLITPLPKIQGLFHPQASSYRNRSGSFPVVFRLRYRLHHKIDPIHTSGTYSYP